MPRLSVKAAFYFSDLTERGRGQTWVIPGTHKLGADQPRPAAQNGESGTRQPVGAIPLLVPPNSCVLFDRRLLHASSPNWSEHERKVVFYVRDTISGARVRLADGTRCCLPQGFGYRWLRSKDVMDVGGALRGTAAACPAVKQLLGWTHVRTFSSPSSTTSAKPMKHALCTQTNNGIFGPKAEDVPLRGWMERHGFLDDAVGIDTDNSASLGTYASDGCEADRRPASLSQPTVTRGHRADPWQSHGDRPHSFNAVKRDGVE